MTAPRLVLPAGSMPWGRWATENAEQTRAAIAAQRADANSAGSVFASQADLMQRQIDGLPSVSDIQRRVIPEFSVTRGAAPEPFHVYDSQTFSFNPPRPDRPYQVSVIAIMRATGIMFPFSYSLLRVGITDYMFRHEALKPGQQDSALFSIMGSASINPGQPVAVTFGIASNAQGTVTFNNTELYCIFTGSIS